MLESVDRVVEKFINKEGLSFNGIIADAGPVNPTLEKLAEITRANAEDGERPEVIDINTLNPERTEPVPSITTWKIRHCSPASKVGQLMANPKPIHYDLPIPDMGWEIVSTLQGRPASPNRNQG